MAGKPKVALNERDRINLPHSRAEHLGFLPGEVRRIIVIAHTVNNTGCGMRNDQFKISLHTKGTLHHKAATGCSAGQEVFALYVYTNSRNLPRGVGQRLDIASIGPCDQVSLKCPG